MSSGEFQLIDAIVAALGESASGPWVKLGAGDDAAVVGVTPGTDAVATIDALVEGVHWRVLLRRLLSALFDNEYAVRACAWRACAVHCCAVCSSASRSVYLGGRVASHC